MDHYKRELSDLEKIDVSEEVASEGSDRKEEVDDVQGDEEEGMQEEDEEGLQEEDEEDMQEVDSDNMQEDDEDNMQEDDSDNMHSAHSTSDEETMIASEDSEKEEKPMDDKQLWEEMQKFGDYEEEEMAKEEAGEASDAEFDIMQPIGPCIVAS